MAYYPSWIGISYADYMECVDFYDLKCVSIDGKKKVKVSCEDDSVEIEITHNIPAGWEGDDLAAYVIAHLPSYDALASILGSINDLFMKDLKQLKPIPVADPLTSLLLRL